MTKLLAVLAELSLVASADANEEAAIAQVRANYGKTTGELATVKTENQKHVEAKKVRVTNRVKAAIEAKKAKPPRTHWDMLMERRTVADLEEVLAERLDVLRARRGTTKSA